MDYYQANCWENLKRENHLNTSNIWSWEQPEVAKQIFHLRRAIQCAGFDLLPPLRRCQIKTNLANQLNGIGRFIEALEEYGAALEIEPQFGMALGNRGSALTRYGSALYDERAMPPFGGFAHLDLRLALDESAIYVESPEYQTAVQQGFERVLECIESLFEIKHDIINARTLIKYKLGKTRTEKHYKQWCLDNVLFLNPLNDIQPHSAAAIDSLVHPPIIASIKDPSPPATIGFFSSLKQEFVTARWMLYQGMTNKQLHFSDKDTSLTDTFDYPSYSYATEHLKASYRVSYSILDKIAFLLNHYFKIGLEEHKVSFRSLWYSDPKVKIKTIRDCFEKSENWPLRGLYWLSQDIYEPSFQDVLAPEAKELKAIRNDLEHKYLRIHQMDISEFAPKTDDSSLGYLISRSDFELKSLRLLKLARAALIYLSLGLHSEEKKRKAALGDKVLAPMELHNLDDKWKSMGQ